LCGRVGEHTPEEVDFVTQRLIANQKRALLHHPAFDPRSHLQRRMKHFEIIKGSRGALSLLREGPLGSCTDLMEPHVSVRARLQAPQAGGEVPETHVTVLRLSERRADIQ